MTINKKTKSLVVSSTELKLMLHNNGCLALNCKTLIEKHGKAAVMEEYRRRGFSRLRLLTESEYEYYGIHKTYLDYIDELTREFSHTIS